MNKAEMWKYIITDYRLSIELDNTAYSGTAMVMYSAYKREGGKRIHKELEKMEVAQ
jgi:hypothetical protein